MKKLLKLLLVVLMIFTVSGCSGKSASDYYDLLKENDYKILVTFDYKHFYDEDLGWYDEKGKEIDPVRIMDKPAKNKFYLLINKDREEIITVYVDKDTDEISSFNYSNDDGYYIANFKDKKKYAGVWIREGTNTDSCEVAYEGKTDGKKCPSKQIKVADNIKKEYEEVLKNLEIKEEDLIDTFTWFNKEKTPAIKEKITDKYKDQKALSNQEIIDSFKENKFLYVKDSDGTMNFKYISSLTDSDNTTITGLLDENNKLIGIVFLKGSYYKPYDGSVGKMYCYYVDSKTAIVTSTDGEYIYNLDTEQSLGEKECDDDFKKESGTLEFVFEKTLDESFVTLDELINFFKTYKD
ncbi:MAG: hypothetical protein ACLR9T_00885 [Thomasclavelia sp.]|uniref:hypothetical protein n=1 Tax=Thomasclavelia sp. TaxID=3025757 RepID=UPI0039A00837